MISKEAEIITTALKDSATAQEGITNDISTMELSGGSADQGWWAIS